ncbi:MAG: hypothetical protein U0746_11005 [Gemmataceae bacterium]
MSLLVNAYTRNESGAMQFLDPEDHGQELAGFEVYRTTFYGGKAARSLNLRLLPSLVEGDLYVEGAALTDLREEANRILSNMDLFTEEAVADGDSLRFRIQNILGAVQRATKAGGGVVIW